MAGETNGTLYLNNPPGKEGFFLNAATIDGDYTIADNDILKYDSASSSFIAEPDRIANHLTTNGDLLGFSTTEARFPVGTNDYPLVANSSATFGVNYAQLATAGIADDAVSAGKLADTAVSAGSYTLSSITVDAQGRLTSASSGTPGATAGFSVAMAIAL